ncbi:glycosyltransferase family 4 protein [Alkalihalobacillus trypoxylicola]|uniref:Lipopolysaccharide N-acetylglucosaminyltransferase n=1 Tax=Alkalihalobacillus trypoxylicola TaxID=519424 RepID=A0A162EFB5_9BACI|nr:glycosyltransferase family 4 protein [Alkalihalobacillus trypoxylicola]KYG32436.1 lipopolysaccharide N-acetylglucosaminyltransferase [Alkalihalobacillus trypoxylicola]
MNILMICTEKLPVPPIRGGAIQTYIDGVSSILAKEHQLTILGRDDSSLENDESVEGIRYVRVKSGTFENYAEGVKEFLRSHSFDIIHLFNRPRLVKYIREVAPQTRLVLSMHNDMFTTNKISSKEAEETISQLDQIVTVSNYIGRTIAELYPQAENKLKTVYSGVDIGRFVPPHSEDAQRMRRRIREENNLQNKKVILYAGRLSANKGADILVQAMPELAKRHSDIALIIVGSKWFSDDKVSDYVAYVRALASRLPIPVINTGFVAPDEIQNWFAAADVFVCPSQWQEPLARVHYEAMASGLPIITTARGGNPEVILPNENGIVIENPENPQEFTEQLTHIFSNLTQARNMGQYGRKLAESNYTWERVASDILDVWKEVERKIHNHIPISDENIEPLTKELVSTIHGQDTQIQPIKLIENESEGDIVKNHVSTKENVKSILLYELSNKNSLIESLLEKINKKAEDKNHTNINQIIQSTIGELEEMIEKVHSNHKKKEATNDVVNDISTAKLYLKNH